jgi:hypothetical protein
MLALSKEVTDVLQIPKDSKLSMLSDGLARSSLWSLVGCLGECIHLWKTGLVMICIRLEKDLYH